jgi:hypothetical protein
MNAHDLEHMVGTLLIAAGLGVAASFTIAFLLWIAGGRR